MFVVCTVAALIVIVGVGSIIFLNILDNGYKELIEHDTRITIGLHQVEVELEKSALNASTYLVTNNKKYAEAFNSAYQALQERLDYLQGITKGEELKKVKQIAFEVQAYHTHLAGLIDYAKQGEFGLMKMMLNQGLINMEETLSFTSELINNQEQVLAKKIADNKELIALT